jgi:hypothetical protein
VPPERVEDKIFRLPVIETWGQCNDRNFLRLSDNFRRKYWRFSLKQILGMIKYLHKLALFCLFACFALFLAKIFLKNVIKN